MPDYQAIYNHVVSTDSRYNLAENSPGLRTVMQATDQLKMLSGRALDVGCGVGFVVEYLAGPTFDLLTFGADISDKAIEKAKQRLAHVGGSAQRLVVLDSQQLPFEEEFFALITCFDVLEHLDPDDIIDTWLDIQRVLRAGGIFLGSVSCRKSGVSDQFGDNLHRTVQSVDWWIEKLKPDHVEYDSIRSQLKIWKRSPLVKVANRHVAEKSRVQRKASMEERVFKSTIPAAPSADDNTAELYQKIYDENPWYGNAIENRCPGVRLLPKFSEFLLNPVFDLGCGRGQTVEQMRSLGFVAEGIDQIRNHPEMRIGDITKPIDDINQFNSVVCVDCIEHLNPGQVEGLFENMKQVKRQIFSIHNGESTGTGQELHVNRQSFEEWETIICKHVEIVSKIPITPDQTLYLTRSKE